MQKIFDKINSNIQLTSDDAIQLLNIKKFSSDYFELLKLSNLRSKNTFGSKGYLFAQIGINATPCNGCCKFCSLSKDNYIMSNENEKSIDEIIKEVNNIDFKKVNALFLMTTANYSKDKYLEIVKAVKKVIPSEIDLVANVGDFDVEYANNLKSCGITGVYHIVRLREEIDTGLQVSDRIKTIEAIRSAGLQLYYCVEPIGKEHTPEELVREMVRAREYGVDIMAAMRRVNVNSSEYSNDSELDEYEFAKIAAVTNLFVQPKISMNVHEPSKTAMIAGINQLYVEIGINPRDSILETSGNRGYTTIEAEALLKDLGYNV
ncbi:radical SAM protein [Anaerorhabdus sp.]|uniref:radical SAM protein n=1 Tax=Anaerorhabdus sp. TaxID=1872524 RepID=UPI002FC924BD